MAKAKRESSGFVAWLPFVVGILLTPAALRAASVMALSGADALTALFPWAQVINAAVLHLPADVAMSTSQLLMYLQFPIYGLIMVKLRERGFVIGLGAVALLHVLGAVAAIILGHMSNPSLRFY
jgi:hypothetical protein